jgi:hypothetical protein
LSDSGAEGDVYPGTIDEDQLLSDSGDDNDRAVDGESDSGNEIAGFVSDADKWLEISKSQRKSQVLKKGHDTYYGEVDILF